MREPLASAGLQTPARTRLSCSARRVEGNLLAFCRARKIRENSNSICQKWSNWKLQTVQQAVADSERFDVFQPVECSWLKAEPQHLPLPYPPGLERARGVEAPIVLWSLGQTRSARWPTWPRIITRNNPTGSDLRQPRPPVWEQAQNTPDPGPTTPTRCMRGEAVAASSADQLTSRSRAQHPGLSPGMVLALSWRGVAGLKLPTLASAGH